MSSPLNQRVSALEKVTLVDNLIAQIERDMQGGRYPPGSFMGTQSDLCAAYGVTGPIFFQASRVLMHRGLVELRPGNRGGLFAADDSVAHVGKRMATYLECIGVDFADAVSVSQLLQALCVQLATGNVDIEAAAAIRAATRRLSSNDYFDRSRLLSQLFQQFAEASGNVALALLYRVITDVMLDITAPGDAAEHKVPPARFNELATRIAEGVVAADHERAADAYRQFRNALIRWQSALPAPDRAPLPNFAEREAAVGNLPERLAAHILREIRQSRWPVGEKLGNEPALLARYGVSRATFRQAIRLLEEYSAVETKRGPKGGVLIASPSAALVNDTALGLLQRRGADRAMVRALLAPLMALAVETALGHGEAARGTIAVACAERGGDARRRLDTLAGALLAQARLKVLRLFVALLAQFEAGLPAPPWSADEEHRFGMIVEALAAAVAGNDRDGARCAVAELVRRFGVGRPLGG